jgi:hypothetical protein
MGAGAPQILAVTTNASLVMGLTFLPRDWEVSSQAPDVDGALDGDVVVLDLGSTGAGLEALGRLSPPGRAVVIGTDEPHEQPPRGVLVLLRPYTIDELAARIEHLVSSQGAEVVEWPELSAPFATTTADELAEVPAQHQAPHDGDPALSNAESAGRERRTDRQERRRSLPSRLFGRVAGEQEAEEAPVAEQHARESSVDDNVVDLTQGSTDELAVDREDLPDRPAPMAPPSPMPSTPSPPPPPAAASAVAAPATTLLERRVIQVPEASDPEPATVARPTRWRARRQTAAPEPERQLRKRLARVLAATTELEELVEQVPLLADLPTLGVAIVREVAQVLDADTVGLWQRGDDGWRVLAHSGLTKHEATWVVPFEQPLFSEVDASGGALLLDPVDAVQAAVTGIGGAHTESFMAAAVAAGPGRYGILAVGRDRPLTEQHLDTLGDLALEMAPGLAVAQQLERLGAISTPRAVAVEEASKRRSWRVSS